MGIPKFRGYKAQSYLSIIFGVILLIGSISILLLNQIWVFTIYKRALILYRPRRFINHLLNYLLTYKH